MTLLKTPISRETTATQFERGKPRPVIITLEPPSLLGFRLKGTKRTYYLDAGSCYDLACKIAVEKAKPKRGRRR